ncbi:MAG: hypothetical protein GYB65_15305 [Chloroflexi bacterium]|nr:hypothetical protein [Chloroflexota bacterium]
MQYGHVVYQLGKFYRMLRELEAAGMYQGEHTIAYTADDGSQSTIHVYIDGTEVQMCDTPGSASLGFSVDVSSEGE